MSGKPGTIIFKPKIIDTFKDYNKEKFFKDLIAGVIVGVVALPLAIAFGIASGVSPEKGLVTAIIAGFIISALGGSRVQIGGPTGAFIVVVYGIVQQFGIEGLIIATFMAGIILVAMGIAQLGMVIKFIPYPLIAGFTIGIAVIIFSAQMKDFFGLKMGAVPAEFIDKWTEFGRHAGSADFYSFGIAAITILIITQWQRVTAKVPGSLVAILATTAAAYFLKLPVETIGSRFGAIPSAIPAPEMPEINLSVIRQLIKPAVTIAILGGIESLLSAVVADGMVRGNHRSNTELIAQGVANMGSAIFGGIPATGAIARTATNIKNGAVSPVAGIVHAITLLLILLFVGEWAAFIPMATLAGILIVVAYNMSEWKHFVFILRGSKSDAAVLLVTFFLTVLADLTVAIEVGMITAVFLFMRKVLKTSSVTKLSSISDAEEINNEYKLPKGVEVFEINGPMFFGAAYKFKDAIKVIETPPKVLVVRMKNVPIIDATGVHVMKDIIHDVQQQGTKIILSEVSSEQVVKELRKARLVFKIGKANMVKTFEDAVMRSKDILQETEQ